MATCRIMDKIVCRTCCLLTQFRGAQAATVLFTHNPVSRMLAAICGNAQAHDTQAQVPLKGSPSVGCKAVHNGEGLGDLLQPRANLAPAPLVGARHQCVEVAWQPTQRVSRAALGSQAMRELFRCLQFMRPIMRGQGTTARASAPPRLQKLSRTRRSISPEAFPTSLSKCCKRNAHRCRR